MIAKEVTHKEKLIEAADAIEVLESSVKGVPDGYIRMELSTKGLLGAPKVFHVRTFDTRQIVSLSMVAESELPLKLSNILDELIYEEISIKDFHENEVVELIVKLFAIFYESTIELDFPWNEDDIAYLEKEGKSELAMDLKNGVWKPKVMVNLGTLDFYKVDTESIKRVVELTSKKTGFKLKFSYPRFGDVIVTKKYLDASFKHKDPEIQDIIKKLEIRKRLFEDAEKAGKEVNSSLLPYIPTDEIEKYTAYETDRALFAVDLVRALHLESFDGKDLSKSSLKEKIECISDPRINHNVTKTIEKEFKKMEFGIRPDILIKNPITSIEEPRRFLFRILDILQAIQAFDSDEYDVGYE